MSVKALLREARKELDDGQLDAARLKCETVLSDDASNYQALILLGISLNRLNQSAAALEAYDRAIAAKPDQPHAYKGIVDVLKHVEQNDVSGLRRRAHAHNRLAALSERHQGESSRHAASDFLEVFLAGELGASARDAAEAWQRLWNKASDKGSSGSPLFFPENRREVVRVDAALAVFLGEVNGCGEVAETSDEHHLSDVLDALERAPPTGTHEVDVRARRLLKQRILVLAEQQKINDADALERLSRIGEFERAVTLAMARVAEAPIRSHDVRALAHRAVRYRPFEALQGCALPVLYLLGENPDGHVWMESYVATSESANGKVRVPSATDLWTATMCAHLACAKNLLYRRRAGDALRFLSPAEESRNMVENRALIASLRVARGQAHFATSDFEASARLFQETLNAVNVSTDDASSMKAFVALVRTVSECALYESLGRSGIAGGQQASAVLDRMGKSGNRWLAEVVRAEKAWQKFLATRDTVGLNQFTAVVGDGLASVARAQLSVDAVDLGLHPGRFVGHPLHVASRIFSRLAQARFVVNVDRDPLAERKTIMQAIELDPQNTDAFALLGWLFHETALGRHTSASESERQLSRNRALRCYTKALTLDPQHALAGPQLVGMYREEGAKGAAQQVVSTAFIDGNAPSWALHASSWQFLAQGRAEDACVGFQRAQRELRMKHNCTTTLYSVAYGEPFSDREAWSRLQMDCWVGQAHCHRKVGRLASAQACLVEAMDINARLCGGRSAARTRSCAEALHSGVLGIKVERSMQSSRSAVPREVFKALDTDSIRNSTEAGGDKSRETRVRSHVELLRAADCYNSLGVCWRESGWIFRSARCFRNASSSYIAGIRGLAAKHAEVNPALAWKQAADAMLQSVVLVLGLGQRCEPSNSALALSQSAVAAYSRALKYAPWDARHRKADLIRAVALYAHVRHDDSSLRFAISAAVALRNVELLLACLGSGCHRQTDVSALAAAVRGLVTAPDRSSMSTAAQLAAACFFLRNMPSASSTDIRIWSQISVESLQQNPVSSRAWEALGLARAAEANRSQASQSLRPAIDALRAADRNGGDLSVSGNLAEVLAAEVRALEGSALDAWDLAQAASVACAERARAGQQPDEVCCRIARAAPARRHMAATSRASESGTRAAADVAKARRSHHFFPFLARTMAQSALCP